MTSAIDDYDKIEEIRLKILKKFESFLDYFIVITQRTTFSNLLLAHRPIDFPRFLSNVYYGNRTFIVKNFFHCSTTHQNQPNQSGREQNDRNVQEKHFHPHFLHDMTASNQIETERASSEKFDRISLSGNRLLISKINCFP